MSWSKEAVQEAVRKVTEKAATDPGFRTLVLSDVRSAVKEATGLEIPASFKIQIVDNTGYNATIVLPEAKASADELSETELESVAGGSKLGTEDFFSRVSDPGYGIAKA